MKNINKFLIILLSTFCMSGCNELSSSSNLNDICSSESTEVIQSVISNNEHINGSTSHQVNNKKDIPIIEDEEGTYKIIWGIVKGASYVDANGESLKLSAELDDVISFKISSEKSNRIYTVICNGKTIYPDNNGIYSVTVKGETRINTGIIGYEEVTYVVENNPEWLQNDGCCIFVWVWGPTIEGQWVECEIKGTTFSFTTDEELIGFTFVRCVRGTTYPNWSTTGDDVGRINNKSIDFICVPGFKSYDGSTAWVQYNP